MRDHLEPWIQDTPLGWLPQFSGQPSAAGIFTAALVLTIMIIPITSAICRELFIRVPKDLTDGALALGSTRWESIRGVMFAYAAPGIVAAVLLGLGRAFGEAIAVNQTIGNRNAIPSSWFEPGDSLGSKIASEYVGATSLEQASSILYLAAILMVISLVTNLVAQFIVSPLRAGQESRMSELTVDPYDITVKSNGLRRRRIVERVFGVLAIGSAAHRLRDPRPRPRNAGGQGLQLAQSRLLHEGEAALRREGRHCRRARRKRAHRRHGDAHGDPGRRARRDLHVRVRGTEGGAKR